MNCPACNKAVMENKERYHPVDRDGRTWHAKCAMEKLAPLKPLKGERGCPECGLEAKMTDFHDAHNRRWHGTGKSCITEALARLYK